MIEIFRKGFRLDIPPETVVTFKKAQNLNGIQNRYAYSNTVSAEKTANNIKLLELFDLPTNKVNSLQNGFTVDVILNGSIQLRNQTMQLPKENRKTIDLYLLYSDNALVVKLKEQYINAIVSDLKYTKTAADFTARQSDVIARPAFVETQDKSGLFVIEEMPILINLQEIVRRIFETNAYTVYGTFFEANNDVSKYYVAPNQGVYQVYSGSGDGFSPVFASDIDLFTFLSWALQFFNSYADLDDTYKTVVVNKWTDLGNYKTNYVDYSKYFDDYKDFAFQSKLAKTNKLTYADSGDTFNSFFSNTLSSQAEATYLASAFGAGSLNIFADSEIDPETGEIGVRANGELGESSAVRIMKVSAENVTGTIYTAGVPQSVSGRRAIPVSMRDVYTEFHKDYTDFILTPVVQNIIFKYDAILAATFSMTKVFFIEQQSAYWIPLEINFSTKKDEIMVKAMLVKKRKVPSPILNDFNSVYLDFKEKAIFPLEYLLGMYPMPPNQYPIQDVIFRSYDQTKNTLYVNDVLVPSASLPQVFSQSSLISIKIEANEPSDTVADTDTDSLYLQVVDTNGGISNEAFINIKHTGVASLESNFVQLAPQTYSRSGFDSGGLYVNTLDLAAGLKPNLNNTGAGGYSILNSGSLLGPEFELITSADNYTNVKVDFAFNVTLMSDNNGLGNARNVCEVHFFDGVDSATWAQVSVTNNSTKTFTMSGSKVLPSLPPGRKLRVYLICNFDNTRGSDLGSIDARVDFNSSFVNITTIKTI